jgi:hypothetical protein
MLWHDKFLIYFESITVLRYRRFTRSKTRKNCINTNNIGLNLGSDRLTTFKMCLNRLVVLSNSIFFVDFWPLCWCRNKRLHALKSLKDTCPWVETRTFPGEGNISTSPFMYCYLGVVCIWCPERPLCLGQSEGTAK